MRDSNIPVIPVEVEEYPACLGAYDVRTIECVELCDYSGACKKQREAYEKP